MYADQSRTSLDKDKSVFDTVSEGNEEIDLGGRTVKSRAYLSWFNFKGQVSYALTVFKTQAYL